ncbi:MAG: DUF3301 domain-containing protein [Stenotrophomonas sp.]
MPSLILLMIAGAAGYSFWNASRAAAETASHHSRQACEQAGVQWLDQSVHAIAIRPCRLENGWLGFQRTYRFEYSRDGADRYAGRIVLRGEQLIQLAGPTRATPTVVYPASLPPAQE